ncbi:hypothetical protein F4809DRAFT_610825 [Biscogniauxia mediterranea]|nr:hypothetical protein F4809DRAFT_610825 [Biscogniauxia mediterranea]
MPTPSTGIGRYTVVVITLAMLDAQARFDGRHLGSLLPLARTRCREPRKWVRCLYSTWEKQEIWNQTEIIAKPSAMIPTLLQLHQVEPIQPMRAIGWFFMLALPRDRSVIATVPATCDGCYDTYSLLSQPRGSTIHTLRLGRQYPRSARHGL